MSSSSSLSASVSRVGLVSGEDVCGCSGGASQDSPDAVLLQTLQGPGAAPSSRQHLLRLPGQPGHLPAGRSDFPLLVFSRGLCGLIRNRYCALAYEKLAASSKHTISLRHSAFRFSVILRFQADHCFYISAMICNLKWIKSGYCPSSYVHVTTFCFPLCC